jgi:hypothetical protein
MDCMKMFRGWLRAHRKFRKEHPPVPNGFRAPKLTPEVVEQIEHSRLRHASDPVTRLSNLTGRIYGRLMVCQLSYALFWWCLCACGEFIKEPIHSEALIKGRVKDCGCMEEERQRLVKFRAKKKKEWGW